ncbi:SDR family NAD(P)-dependent oxidoreductase [Patescibacteria group bacterium]|nr:SDR family NAD(P)-dependent oxidoreductase [Patescibacteria group bacterium]
MNAINIPSSNILSGRRFIITGCGYKPVEHIFYDPVTNKPCHNEMQINNVPMKINIGAAVAYVLAAQGATVHMISTTREKLENLKQDIIEKTSCEPQKIEYSKVDLLNEKSVSNFVKKLPRDLPINWVQSIGLGAGAYKIKDGNPYLPLEEISVELLEKESSTVLRGTHIMMQNLLPIFKKQSKQDGVESRIIIISSMSAIRGYIRGGTHCAAKGAISRYANAAMLELWKDKIYVTDMRPGGIDTGGYDNQVVQESILKIDNEYGRYWRETGIHFAQPISVGYAVNMILSAPGAHVTSMNLVAKGQCPNEGS